MICFKDKEVKIRKPQICWGCCTEFKKGTFLRYTTSVDMGELCSAYWCEVCSRVLNNPWVDLSDGISMGELTDSCYRGEVMEAFFEIKEAKGNSLVIYRKKPI